MLEVIALIIVVGGVVAVWPDIVGRKGGKQ